MLWWIKFGKQMFLPGQSYLVPQRGCLHPQSFQDLAGKTPDFTVDFTVDSALGKYKRPPEVSSSLNYSAGFG